MKKTCSTLIWGLVLICTVFLYGNCGTTGSDDHHTTPIVIDASAQDPANSNPVNFLHHSLCEGLTACREGLTEDGCREKALASTTLAMEFGVPEGMFESYQEVVDLLSGGEWEGVLDGNEDSFLLCLSSLENISCDDPAVQALDIDTFEGIENTVPDEYCPEVFFIP